MRDRDMEDQLVLYGKKFSSRLLLGTARYESPHQLTDAISAADPAMLTVSLRRQVSRSKDSASPFGVCSKRRKGQFFRIPPAVSVRTRQ